MTLQYILAQLHHAVLPEHCTNNPDALGLPRGAAPFDTLCGYLTAERQTAVISLFNSRGSIWSTTHRLWLTPTNLPELHNALAESTIPLDFYYRIWPSLAQPGYFFNTTRQSQRDLLRSAIRAARAATDRDSLLMSPLRPTEWVVPTPITQYLTIFSDHLVLWTGPLPYDADLLDAHANPFASDSPRARQRAALRRAAPSHATLLAKAERAITKLNQQDPPKSLKPTPRSIFESWKTSAPLPPPCSDALRTLDYSTRPTHPYAQLPSIGAEFELDNTGNGHWSHSQFETAYREVLTRAAQTLSLPSLDNALYYCRDASLSGRNPGELKTPPVPRNIAPVLLHQLAAMLRDWGFDSPPCCGGHLTVDLHDVPRPNRPLIPLIILNPNTNRATFQTAFGRQPNGYCSLPLRTSGYDEPHDYDTACQYATTHMVRFAVYPKRADTWEFRQPSGNALLQNPAQQCELINSLIDWAKGPMPDDYQQWDALTALDNYLGFIAAKERYHQVLEPDRYKLSARVIREDLKENAR